VLIWTLAGTTIWLLRSGEPSAGATIAFLRRQNIARMPAAERDIVMLEAANQLNRLGFLQVRAVRDSRAFFEFYQPLEPLEKEKFASLIIPAGVRRILNASREVPADQRAEFLRKALYLAVLELSTPNPPIDPEALKRLELEALKAYFGSLSGPESKEMAPQLKVIREYVRLNP
jgi:hypothetical protein